MIYTGYRQTYVIEPTDTSTYFSDTWGKSIGNRISIEHGKRWKLNSFFALSTGVLGAFAWTYPHDRFQGRSSYTNGWADERSFEIAKIGSAKEFDLALSIRLSFPNQSRIQFGLYTQYGLRFSVRNMEIPVQVDEFDETGVVDSYMEYDSERDLSLRLTGQLLPRIFVGFRL